MANDNWDDFDGDESRDDDGPKQLREAFNRLKKENAKLQKEHESLQKRQRQTDVKNILEEVGANPKVARFVLQDIEDVTKENVVEWVSENGELFGISTDAPKGDAPAEPPKGMSPDEANALTALNQFHAPQPSGPSAAEEELRKRIREAKDPDELISMLGINKTQAF